MRHAALPTAITSTRRYGKIEQAYQLLPPQRASVLLGLKAAEHVLIIETNCRDW